VLIERVRAALAGRADVVEKQMVGGRSYMISGRLAVGVVGEELMVRLEGSDYEQALDDPHVRPMTMGGRPLKNYLLVAAAAVDTDADLDRWISRATEPESGSPSAGRRRS